MATTPLTLPFTTQQPYATMRCLISTSDALEPIPTWVEYTTKMRSYEFTVGRNDERSLVDAGTATIVLDNNDRALDPNAHAEVGPRNRVWLLEEFDGKTRTRFKGYVQSYKQQWDRSGVKDATVEVHAADELMLATRSKLPTMDPPTAPDYQSVIQQDNPSAYYRWEELAPFRTTSTTVYDEEYWVWMGMFTGEVRQDPITSVVSEIPGWYSSGGYNVANDPAVVGDLVGSSEDGSGGCLVLGSGAGITSSDGRAGEMMGSQLGSIECWFKRSGVPGSATDFWAGPKALSTVNRIWNWRLNTDGSVTFFRWDGAALQQVSTYILAQDTWYHLCAVNEGFGAALLRMYVNGAQVSTVASSSIWADIDETVPMVAQYPGVSVRLDEMAIFPSKVLSPSRVLAHYTAGALRGYPQQTAGVRIGAVLDTIGSQAPRSLRAGTRTLHPTFMAGRAPTDEAAQCQNAEAPDAVFFCALDGTLTFLDAGHRSVAPWNTSAATFDDDGTDLAYMGVDGFEESDAQIVNEWNVSRIGRGSIIQTASDATSRRRYGPSPESISDLRLTLNSDALAIANALLAKYKDPLSRVTELTPKTVNQNVMTALMDLDLFRKITVIRRPPGGGSAITSDVWIQKWQQSGTPGVPPTVRLTVSTN